LKENPTAEKAAVWSKETEREGENEKEQRAVNCLLFHYADGDDDHHLLFC
jgi:hypothetical protein